MSKRNEKGCNHLLTPDFEGLPYPQESDPQFVFMKMTAKDVKEITYLP